jgi:hypothetical protein
MIYSKNRAKIITKIIGWSAEDATALNIMALGIIAIVIITLGLMRLYLKTLTYIHHNYN